MLQLLPELLLFNYFNPKFFDASYLRIHLNPHILAVKALRDVASSFFTYILSLPGMWAILPLGGFPVCVFSIVLFFLLELILCQTLISSLLYAGTVLGHVRNTKMGTT